MADPVTDNERARQSRAEHDDSRKTLDPRPALDVRPDVTDRRSEILQFLPERFGVCSGRRVRRPDLLHQRFSAACGPDERRPENRLEKS